MRSVAKQRDGRSVPLLPVKTNPAGTYADRTSQCVGWIAIQVHADLAFGKELQPRSTCSTSPPLRSNRTSGREAGLDLIVPTSRNPFEVVDVGFGMDGSRSGKRALGVLSEPSSERHR